METHESIADALDLLGQAYRLDWSDFDGRTLRSQLNELSSYLREGGTFDLEGWAYSNGICPTTGSWVADCPERSPKARFNCVHMDEYYERRKAAMEA